MVEFTGTAAGRDRGRGGLPDRWLRVDPELRRDPWLAGAEDLRRGARRDEFAQLDARDQALRDARGALPFGRYSQQALLELAYSQWKDAEPLPAIATLDRFLKLYPTHPSADYAWYLRGLINFNNDLGLLGSLSRQDVSERDPRAARESFDSFRELLTRFPESRYAPDAAARMKFIVNMLASHEVHVARFYLRKGAYVAAANRAQTALTTYPQAPANEEGLLIMVKAYDAMGLTDLRNDAERVMKANFPKSKYFGADPRGDGRRWWHLW